MILVITPLPQNRMQTMWVWSERRGSCRRWDGTRVYYQKHSRRSSPATERTPSRAMETKLNIKFGTLRLYLALLSFEGLARHWDWVCWFTRLGMHIKWYLTRSYNIVFCWNYYWMYNIIMDSLPTSMILVQYHPKFKQNLEVNYHSIKGWSHISLLYWHPRPGIGDDQVIKISIRVAQIKVKIGPILWLHPHPTHPGWQSRGKGLLAVQSSDHDQGPKMAPIKFWSQSQVSIQQNLYYPCSML